MSTAVDGWRLPQSADEPGANGATAPLPIESAAALHSADARDAAHRGDPADADDGADARDPADAGDEADGDADPATELARIRGEIEALDRRIVGLIADRVALARRVGPLKQALGMPILDPPREAAIVRRAGALARDAGLSDEDVRYVFWHLVGLSRRVQLEEG